MKDQFYSLIQLATNINVDLAKNLQSPIWLKLFGINSVNLCFTMVKQVHPVTIWFSKQDTIASP